jgi:26S proteasome regulatory subunit N1
MFCCAQDDDERDVLREIISNSKLSEHFLALARDLDVMEPKMPEDVYKTHLTGGCGFVQYSVFVTRLD